MNTNALSFQAAGLVTTPRSATGGQTASPGGIATRFAVSESSLTDLLHKASQPVPEPRGVQIHRL